MRVQRVESLPTSSYHADIDDYNPRIRDEVCLNLILSRRCSDFLFGIAL